jgi:hypothetical protein
MSRPDTADYLALTIESNFVNTDIPGAYAAIEALSWRRIVLRSCSALNVLTSRAHAGIGQTSADSDDADSNGRSISPLQAQRTKLSIRTPASSGNNAAGW